MRRECRVALFLSLAICLLVLPALGQAQESDSDITTLRAAVSSFLRTWLVEKDRDAAMSFFSPQAFGNSELLNNSCAGYAASGEAARPNDPRTKVRGFLQDFNVDLTVDTIADVLSVRRFEEQPGVAAAVNDWKSDGFLLLELDQDGVSEDQFPRQTRRLLRKELEVSPLYVSIVLLEKDDIDGGIYLVWKQEGSRWRIIYIDMICQ